jgi:hypothetical protein
LSEPRRHHLVPEHHLRRFANAKDQVRVVLRSDATRSFVTAINKVAVECDFYAVDTSAGPSLVVENMLSTIESEAARAAARLVTDGLPPSRDDRYCLAAFTAAQLLRGWDMREATTSMMAHVAQMVALNVTRKGVKKFFAESQGRDMPDDEVERIVAFARDPSRYRIEVPPEHHLQTLVSMLPQVTELVAARRWLLFRMPTPLLTSDSPVSIWSRGGRPSGFGNADELAWAIDRNHALIMVRVDLAETKAAGSLDEARELNFRTASNARRFVIHHPDDAPLDGVQLPDLRPKMTMSHPPSRFVSEDE